MAPAPGPRRSHGGRGLGFTLIVALLAGVLGGAGTYLMLRDDAASGGRVEPLPQADVDESPPAEGSIAEVVERVLPVVVTVEAISRTTGGSGSGFILDDAGHILTNNHVISPAADGGTISVGLADVSGEPAALVGRNASYDLAVLRIDRTGLVAAALGNSDSVRVGDTAIAIGAPLGLSETVTQGIISALDSPVTAGGVGETAFISAIQTDAAINPGNSGGPLLNARGEVIGVNSAIATLADRGQESGSIGLGFSIPINQAIRVADEIIATGASTTPVIGVTLDLSYNGEGARIGEVNPGGPADEAGLEPDDVVVAVDGEPVANSTEFVVVLRTNAPGDTVELTLADGSTVRVRLEGREES
jgi:putative serine protease PepD